LQLHETIFELVWFGEGRWSWQDIYNMPIFLRRFWIKKVKGIIKQQEDTAKQQLQKIKSNKTSLPTKHRG